jgi:hypothetical protein
MLFRKPPVWNLQPGLVARPWREHWRGVKAVFPFWEPGGRSIYPLPRGDRWSLNNGAVRALTRYGPAVYFPGSTGNEVETADANPIVFEAGEPYTIALLILWTEDPGNEGIFRSGSANTGSWLWMLSGGKLWGRHANINSPASGSGPLITAGWHTLARVWDGQEVRQYVDGLRTNTLRPPPPAAGVGNSPAARGSMKPTCRSSAPSAPPGTTPWSRAEAPIRWRCCGQRWVQRL